MLYSSQWKLAVSIYSHVEKDLKLKNIWKKICTNWVWRMEKDLLKLNVMYEERSTQAYAKKYIAWEWSTEAKCSAGERSTKSECSGGQRSTQTACAVGLRGGEDIEEGEGDLHERDVLVEKNLYNLNTPLDNFYHTADIVQQSEHAYNSAKRAWWWHAHKTANQWTIWNMYTNNTADQCKI